MLEWNFNGTNSSSVRKKKKKKSQTRQKILKRWQNVVLQHWSLRAQGISRSRGTNQLCWPSQQLPQMAKRYLGDQRDSCLIENAKKSDFCTSLIVLLCSERKRRGGGEGNLGWEKLPDTKGKPWEKKSREKLLHSLSCPQDGEILAWSKNGISNLTAAFLIS